MVFFFFLTRAPPPPPFPEHSAACAGPHHHFLLARLKIVVWFCHLQDGFIQFVCCFFIATEEQHFHLLTTTFDSLLTVIISFRNLISDMTVGLTDSTVHTLS